MKKIWTVLLVLVLSIGVLVPTSAMDDGKLKSQEYLVGFNGSINKDLLRSQGIKEELIRHEFIYMPTLLMELTPSQVEELKKNPEVEYIEENTKLHMNEWVPEIPIVRPPWNITRIQADRVLQDFDYTGENVKVAVIDGGIGYHPDLNDNIAGGVSFVSSWPGDPFHDPSGHGTHIAGIINQVAPDAHLYSVKVLDNNLSGSIFTLAQGIEWSRANGMNIINISFGGSTSSTTLEHACNNATNSGVMIFAAALPTGGMFPQMTFPARYNSVMAVGATDRNNVRHPSSAIGPVYISAPGVDIISTVPGGGHATRTGVSYGSPHVAGVAALLKSANPEATLQQIISTMAQTAENIGPANEYGAGLVKAYDAMYHFLPSIPWGPQ